MERKEGEQREEKEREIGERKREEGKDEGRKKKERMEELGEKEGRRVMVSHKHQKSQNLHTWCLAFLVMPPPHYSHQTSQAEDGGGGGLSGLQCPAAKIRASMCNSALVLGGFFWFAGDLHFIPRIPQCHCPFLWTFGLYFHSSSSLACRKIFFATISTKVFPMHVLSLCILPQNTQALKGLYKNSITLDLESTTLLYSYTSCSQADIDPLDRILLLTVFLSSPSFLRASSNPSHRYVPGLVLPPSCTAGVPIMRANQREQLGYVSVPENQVAIDPRTQRTTRGSVPKTIYLNNTLKSQLYSSQNVIILSHSKMFAASSKFSTIFQTSFLDD